ncbi:MAG: ribosome assembly RNA-binding protein YhbY [Gammaproteobacteria bacterium]|nr:ribosome assembly RNA-binding protein YhbY [Gammaproteobacteria bacterium]
MQLTGKQNRFLRSRAHSLRPVILMGSAGLTQALIDETARALRDHELIKVRLVGEDREDRRGLADALCAATGAGLVQIIGHVAIIYLPGDPPVIRLP